MKGTLDERRQARAAGSHPLQASFRQAAASLLAKHNMKVCASCAHNAQGDSQAHEGLPAGKACAAGSHPLQASFRQAAASLLAKHGKQVQRAAPVSRS